MVTWISSPWQDCPPFPSELERRQREAEEALRAERRKLEEQQKLLEEERARIEEEKKKLERLRCGENLPESPPEPQPQQLSLVTPPPSSMTLLRGDSASIQIFFASPMMARDEGEGQTIGPSSAKEKLFVSPFVPPPFNLTSSSEKLDRQRLEAALSMCSSTRTSVCDLASLHGDLDKEVAEEDIESTLGKEIQRALARRKQRSCDSLDTLVTAPQLQRAFHPPPPPIEPPPPPPPVPPPDLTLGGRGSTMGRGANGADGTARSPAHRLKSPIAVDTQKKQQHQQLMDEFRRAHRRMFKKGSEAPSDADDAAEKQNEEEARTSGTVEEKPMKPPLDGAGGHARRPSIEGSSSRSSSGVSSDDGVPSPSTSSSASFNTEDMDRDLLRRLTEEKPVEIVSSEPATSPAVGKPNSSKTNEKTTGGVSYGKSRPPPPNKEPACFIPPPHNHRFIPLKKSQPGNEQPPVGTAQSQRPPPSPVPDYDTATIRNKEVTIVEHSPPSKAILQATLSSSSDTMAAPPAPRPHSLKSSYPPPPPAFRSSSLANGNTDSSSTETFPSLDSLTLHDPTNSIPAPRPPPTYFDGGQDKPKPSPPAVGLVTIAPYGSAALKKTPARMGFLGKPPASPVLLKKASAAEATEPPPIDRQLLQSELRETLNRSKLRQRASSMEDLLGEIHRAPSPLPLTSAPSVTNLLVVGEEDEPAKRTTFATLSKDDSRNLRFTFRGGGSGGAGSPKASASPKEEGGTARVRITIGGDCTISNKSGGSSTRGRLPPRSEGEGEEGKKRSLNAATEMSRL
ncbi:unnamed protein product [Cyprideis torosa]|uniref:Uncharacterized protein n=1 Tax=Cyprideis torosa TaxID=163714 RepID=A0A7R8WEU5_9CRUS|nr:unnamed protein product [Cyprideis torosa]CAG0896053.1 unnamed protein product [Cyprideis torosa]